MFGSYTEPEPAVDRLDSTSRHAAKTEQVESELGQEFRYQSSLTQHEQFYQVMLHRKREAIRSEEAAFKRNLATEVGEIRDLEEREQMLIHTLNDEQTPVSQMLQEYFTFKYERLQRRIDTEIRSNLLGEERNHAGEQPLKYDLGTPILLNNLGYRIHSGLVDTIGSRQKFKDPREPITPRNPCTISTSSPIDKLKTKIMDKMLLTPESQLNYLADQLAHNDEFLTKIQEQQEAKSYR